MSSSLSRPGFATGIRCLWGGLSWLIRTPDAWPLAAVPMALAIGVAVAGSVASASWMPQLIGDLVGPTSGALAGFGAALLKLVATAVAVVLATLLGFTLAQPLSGPALEALVRRRERDLGAPARASTSLLLDVWRSLKSLIVGYMFGLPAMLLLLLLSFVVPAAAIVLFPLKMVVAAITIAWDLCDYPMSVQGMPIGHRLKTIVNHFPALLGFSLGLALASLVPCLLFVLLPAGVVGAAELMFHVDRFEQLDRASNLGA